MTLLEFFLERRSLINEEVRQTSNPSANRRETSRAVSKQLRLALSCFPEQLALIKGYVAIPESEETQFACDWIGIDRAAFVELCAKELAWWNNRADFSGKTYYLWEVAQIQANPHLTTMK